MFLTTLHKSHPAGTHLTFSKDMPLRFLLRQEEPIGNLQLKELRAYRIILLLGAIFTLTLHFYFTHGRAAVYDPIVVRVALSSVLVVIFFLTFFVSYRDKIFFLIYLIFFFYTFHSLVLIYKNNFAINYILELIILTIIICLAFRNRTHIMVFLGLLVVAYSFLCIHQIQSPALVAMHIGLLFSFCAAILLFFDSKLQISKNIEYRDAILKTIFNESPDSLVIVEPETFTIVTFNSRTVEYFELADEADIRNQKLNKLLKDEFSILEYREIDEQISHNSGFTREVEFVSGNKKTFWGNLSIRKINLDQKKYWLVRITDTTQRHEDKLMLEQNRKMLMHIIDLVPHQIYLKDDKSTFMLINKAVEEILEKPRHEILGKSDFDLFDHHEARQFFDDEQRILESLENKHIENETFVDKKGRTRYIQATKMPFFINEIGTYGILGVNIDLTTIKEQQLALQAGEAKFRSLMEQASDGICLVDADGLISEANPKAATLFGFSDSSQLIGKNINSLLLSNTDKKVTFDTDKSTGISEYTFKKKTGERFVAEISTANLQNSGKQLIIRDVTERKTFEQLLVESEKKFRALIENSSDVICILDEKFKLKFITASVKNILGYSAEDSLHLNPLKIIHPEDRGKVREILESLLKKPEQVQFMGEVRLINNSGKYTYFEIFASNLLGNPSINGIIFNCHDINQRKTTEIELLNTNYELDSFVYRASHDIKAPLRSVMGLITIAKIENKDIRIVPYLDMMKKSVENLDSLIKDLTLFSRNSRADIDTQLVDFEKLTSDIVQSLKFMENVDKINIFTEVEEGLNFYSDITRVNTILNNLISNSLKYHKFDIENAYVNIDIVSYNNGVKITVADNGIGIEGEYLDRIFDMFFRASEKSYGSGLGLYIVKIAVLKLKGLITVESRIDEGSIFTVILPNMLINQTKEQEWVQ